ncbi:hypothetical protein FHU10_4102 [Serratia fonticola]|uniref:Uncharacterized protein n=1 Tax=Serratia fonticola TaxID=47917 RepID=A0A542BR95_SERFO|nr:hypothetical protein FHU09_3603 [Serratia fonticola]TQI96979.1 hypothetical protein FHU11_2442 [Serratia fonticola]TVZ71474.1 hypothetical protein FHU10_4102 [Serratia fonticola]
MFILYNIHSMVTASRQGARHHNVALQVISDLPAINPARNDKFPHEVMTHTKLNN